MFLGHDSFTHNPLNGTDALSRYAIGLMFK